METVLSCKICHNQYHNQYFTANERMLGLNDSFEYFECANCKCIQIAEIPKDIDRYYSNDYYSYQPPKFEKKLTWLSYLLKKSLASYYSGNFNMLGAILSAYFENPFLWLKPKMANFNSKILDVGCGTGRKLLSLRRSGYLNLTGIDPYLKEDIFYDNGVRIYKMDIFEVTEKYDVIVLHHSFEHMESPKDILTHLHKLINTNGHIILRIPVGNCYAWRKYFSHWVQLDAPRHFFLHTVKSMTILANECGLKLKHVDYDSTDFQFAGSERYLRGLGFDEKDKFTKKQVRCWLNEAKRLNNINDGDSACFYLQKA